VSALDGALIAVAAIGCGLIVVAAIGLLRMGDVFTRMQAASKASTLGAALVLLAVGLSFGDVVVLVRALAVVVFVVLTAPIAAHAIGRAAWRTGVRLERCTVVNELPQMQPGDQGTTAGRAQEQLLAGSTATESARPGASTESPG
jgi:multicomponent Na+:H+ antiporter subunit G